MTRRPARSVVASPVLVGAITLLVACVAVLLAVQANRGLPFVPSYDLRAELPGGANLIEGNEVRMGGFRVGVIEQIRPAVSPRGAQRSIAVVHMKLDKKVEPLAVDTGITVRPRSALGLKYIELTPGTSARALAAGATIPLENAVKPTELDEFFGLNDAEFRGNQRTTLQGFGNAFAGRGQSINLAIQSLVPFVTHLEPVMRTLSDPDNDLGELFRQSERFSGQIAPVARTYASLFVNMATTFEALSRHPERLRGTIERGAPTLEQAIRSFPVQRPFLAETEELMRRLEPVALEMTRSLPPTTDALETGAPVLARAPALYRETQNVFAALDDLASEPTTLLGLQDLHDLLDVATPLVEWVAPFQTVCNYWNYYWNAIGEHVSEPVPGGTLQRSSLGSDNRTQDNRISTHDADRPADIPSDQPIDSRDPLGDQLVALHAGAYTPAVDAQGKADCQVGQTGYTSGPNVPDSRYGPSTNPAEGGGSHVVRSTDLPGIRYGGTYKARELGIDGIEDVP
ncbi:MAG: MlaD family protein [Thermoleophilaceae bacterium]